MASHTAAAFWQHLPESQLSWSQLQEDVRAELAPHQNCVDMSFYELPHGEETLLKDIPSTFSKASVAKLLIPDIIPAYVKQIVVVDVDTLFLADICQPAR